MKNLWIIFISLCTAQIAGAQLRQNDHLFLLQGETSATIATGIPYVGIGEVAYGVTSGFTVGAIFGVTPLIPGYGLRLRGLLYENEETNFRVHLRAPVFYYPMTKDLGGEPWWLTYPAVAAEWKTSSGLRYSADMGVIAAVCAHSLSNTLFGSGEMEEEEDEMGFEGGIWNTVGAGVALPISEKITCQMNAALVLDGLRIADSHWVGGPPTVVSVALTYQFK
ncbi:MAG: hypothetical protein IPM69_03250 [Ignavibacteria bacterium]|nr:hypothetical protein [Ignavibacteria bacterium]